MVWRRAAVLAVAGGLALGGGAAHADGAFPDGQSILVPPDLPNEIVLATNFGLVTSEDSGASWTWSCEQMANSYGRLYQMGPGPAHRLFAIAGSKLVYSDDQACGWQTAGGALASQSCEDVFVDPVDPMGGLATRVFAAALTFGDGGAVYAVLESTDGGATFDQTLYTGAPGDLVTGVESARSDPMTIDLALSHGASAAPTLARSTDGGATWTLTDLTASLGTGAEVRIVAIDPTDADRVYLRGIGFTGDVLAVATAGGAMVTTPLSFANGALAAFVRASDGTILAAGTEAGAAVLARSTDQGGTFAAIPGAPPVLALAERAGIIYAAVDTTAAPSAEATSADDGTTWTPGLKFADVQAIESCLRTTCQSDCQTRAAQGQWPAAMCTATVVSAVTPAGDGGEVIVIDAGNAPDAVTVGLPGDDGSPVTTLGDAGDTVGSHLPRGCSCAMAPGGGAHDVQWSAGTAVMLAAALLLGRRRR